MITWNRASVALLVTAAAAALLIYAALPSSYRVEGSLRLPGPPATAAAVLGEIQLWVPWRMQPGVQHTTGGAPGKPGSSCYWRGGAGVGSGRLTLLAARPGQLDLEVEVEPGAHEADLSLRLSPDAEGTRVAWTLSGERRRWLAWMDRIPAPVHRFLAELPPALAALDGSVAEALGRDRRVERSARVAASPDMVLRQLTDLRRWKAWLPGERRDPDIARRYGGPRAGTGQSYYWSGTDAVGQGRLTILETGADHVGLEREIARPRAASNDIEIRVVPDGDGARITWAVTGAPPADPGTDPDAALGAEIQESLVRLKTTVEMRALGRAMP